eukprot:TRINITY_DN3785_c1_g1_i2.p1 TRINITY_DN3785_c1_g1~~TRINITY_DN3785_c1_g1_i2.p1  ORF type:complete len:414 (-),score=141.50 TRINITY_DN3785_c1_g1_i2:333-1574(-)
MSAFLQSLFHPDELVALVKFKLTHSSAPAVSADKTDNCRYCYEALTKTSRSFAIVIQELGDELRDAVCVFYLVLRALDTFEDDMEFPMEEKVKHLQQFNQILYQPGWTFSGCGEAHEAELLQNFDRVIEVFLSLKGAYRDVIQDICKRMGAGMIEYLQKEVVTIEDWNLYCHYVAGLVGVGLSGLFAESGLESEDFREKEDLSNSMGLFLQKTNIIRDYLEDIEAEGEARMFWPNEVWGKYATTLAQFKEPEQQQNAVHCLNDLITNALYHVVDSIAYMSSVKDPRNFNFCAIPQVMAIGTLAECYNNHNVFTGVVKLRRGVSAKVFNSVTGDMSSVYQWFYDYARVIEAKIPADDPNRAETRAIVEKIQALCRPHVAAPSLLSTRDVVAGAIIIAAAAYIARRQLPKLMTSK